MADVFISYKAEDRGRVQPLVAALEADGLSVWWDGRIGGGQRWRETIQAQLDTARCVIVVWSQRSVGPEGHFVRDEASRALRRGVYLPVRLENVDPPLGFGETQALSLAGWRGDREDARYQALLAGVHDVTGQTSLGAAPGRARARIDRRAALLGGGALAVAAAGAGGWVWWRGRGQSAAVEKGIVVLPFENLSGDPAQAYFSDGIAEEVRDALGAIQGLRVIGRMSSTIVRDMSPRDIAAKLGVSAILTGSVRRSASDIRVSAQLVDTTRGDQRWSEVYDRAPGDVLVIESGIAKGVASVLNARLGTSETFVGTNNPRAHDLYLKAVALTWVAGDEATWRQALALTDEAIGIDPAYANAHAFRAHALSWLTSNATNMADVRRLDADAERSARRAIALAPQWAHGYKVLIEVLMDRMDMRGAIEADRKAQSVDPNYTSFLLSFNLRASGRANEALAAASARVARDPLDPFAWGNQVSILFMTRRYEETIKVSRQVFAWAPKQAWLKSWSAFALLMLGRPREALEEVSDDGLWRLAVTAMATYRLGDRRASDEALAQMKQRFGETVNYQYAEIFAQRGESEAALAALEEAWRVRDGGLLQLPDDPMLDPLRDQPRFKAVLKQLMLS